MALQNLQENLTRSLAAISTYATEGNMSLVVAEVKHARTLTARQTGALGEKLEAAITDASSQHRRHVELKQEMSCLKKKLNVMEQEEISFTQALKAMDSNEKSQQVKIGTNATEEKPKLNSQPSEEAACKDDSPKSQQELDSSQDLFKTLAK
jgi:hypothetical protein